MDRKNARKFKAVRIASKVGLGIILLLAAGLAALALPQPLFRHHVTRGDWQVWSDRPIDPTIATVLDDASRRLRTSALYTPGQPIRVFICNSSWRLWFYSQRFSSRMGGATDTWLTRNVYLRQADIPRNRLVRTSNLPMLDAAQRPLSYYFAHEGTHVLQSRAFGRLFSLRYPQWLKEGYADYVGKGGDFDLDENRRLFATGDRLLDFRATGLYRRFHLEVAWMLDRKHATVRQLFADPPEQAAVDMELRP